MTNIKSLLGAAGLAAVAMVAAAPVANAEDREFAWSITIGGTSDYIFRGVSFTQEEPAFQASVDFSYGIAYLGFWGSNIDNGDGFEPWELDIYAGLKPVVGPATFDFGVVVYTYPDADTGPNTEYYELKAGVSGEIFKNLTAGAVFWYTPDQSNYSETYSIEGTLAYALPQVGIFAPSISGLIGYTEDTDNTDVFALGGIDSYTYWNAGLTLAVEKFSMDFRYWDTDVDSDPASNDLTDSRFVFSAKVTLP